MHFVLAIVVSGVAFLSSVLWHVDAPFLPMGWVIEIMFPMPLFLRRVVEAMSSVFSISSASFAPTVLAILKSIVPQS